MSRTEEIGSQIMWILGHTLFTLIAVCVVRGGYQFYQDYISLRGLEGTSFDLSMLDVDQKNELLEELMSEPPPQRRK